MNVADWMQLSSNKRSNQYDDLLDCCALALWLTEIRSSRNIECDRWIDWWIYGWTFTVLVISSQPDKYLIYYWASQTRAFYCKLVAIDSQWSKRFNGNLTVNACCKKCHILINTLTWQSGGSDGDGFIFKQLSAHFISWSNNFWVKLEKKNMVRCG